MNNKKLMMAASLATTLLLAGCETNGGLAAAPRDTDARPGSQGAPVAEAEAARKQRVEALLKGVPAKLARRPKAERDADVTAWQQAWAGRGEKTPFDAPQSRMAHFLEKRLQPGATTISPSDYEAALAQMTDMPVYSTLQKRQVVAPRAGMRTRQASSGGSFASGWEAMGPGNIGGRTRALLIHPTTPSTMWAGAVAGGIWKTTDGGASWSPKADLLVNIAVNSVLLDPRNPDVLYAGTGEGFFNADGVRGAGIMKSTDGGETWTQLPSTNTPDFRYVQKIVMSKGSSQRLYAATRTGIFRSNDAGASWTKMIDATAVNGCMDLAIQTDRALANVFASCGTFAQGTVYRALDTAGAQTWSAVMSVPGQGRTSLALAPSNQNIIYALAASTVAGNFNDGLLGVYRSTTGGTAGSWTARVTNASPVKLNTALLSNPVYVFLADCGYGAANQYLNQGWYDNTIAVDPKNPESVWVGGIDLFRSDDGGQNFGQASHWWFTRGVDPEYAHADHHGVVFHPQYDGVNNKVMFNTGDGGIYKTLNARAPVAYTPVPFNSATAPVCGAQPAGMVAWQGMNTGYQVTQFYHGAVYPDGNTFFGGTQDNGTVRGTTGAANAWSEIRGGDGGYVALNPNNTNMLWVENTGLSIQRSTNGGATYSAFTGGITEAGGNFLFIAPFAQDPNSADRMWAGGAYLWRTSAATSVPAPAAPWTRASTFLGARVSAVAVSPLDSNRVYAGTAAQGNVYTSGSANSATGTTAWSSSKPRPGTPYISWITPDPVAAGTVYATISTFNSVGSVGHVFKSVDFGATWTNIDGSGATGIPDVPVHSLVVDPLNTLRMYVGTDVGVFVTLDGGLTWARENTGFANVVVESLVLKNTAPRYLYAFTHGRSVYRVAMDGAPQ